jgi:hypothetical protein
MRIQDSALLPFSALFCLDRDALNGDTLSHLALVGCLFTAPIVLKSSSWLTVAHHLTCGRQPSRGRTSETLSVSLPVAAVLCNICGREPYNYLR